MWFVWRFAPLGESSQSHSFHLFVLASGSGLIVNVPRDERAPSLLKGQNLDNGGLHSATIAFSFLMSDFFFALLVLLHVSTAALGALDPTRQSIVRAALSPKLPPLFGLEEIFLLIPEPHFPLHIVGAGSKNWQFPGWQTPPPFFLPFRCIKECTICSLCGLCFPPGHFNSLFTSSPRLIFLSPPH